MILNNLLTKGSWLAILGIIIWMVINMTTKSPTLEAKSFFAVIVFLAAACVCVSIEEKK